MSGGRGRNEAIFRSVNEEIESLSHGAARLDIVCECAAVDCAQPLIITVESYEHVRSHPARFVVLPGHDDPSVEAIVETTAGYLVVEKRAPDARAVAIDTDPRD